MNSHTNEMLFLTFFFLLVLNLVLILFFLFKTIEQKSDPLTEIKYLQNYLDKMLSQNHRISMPTQIPNRPGSLGYRSQADPSIENREHGMNRITPNYVNHTPFHSVVVNIISVMRSSRVSNFTILYLVQIFYQKNQKVFSEATSWLALRVLGGQRRPRHYPFPLVSGRRCHPAPAPITTYHQSRYKPDGYKLPSAIPTHPPCHLYKVQCVNYLYTFNKLQLYNLKTVHNPAIKSP